MPADASSKTNTYRSSSDSTTRQRERVLLAQLTGIVAELVRLIDARQELHDRLARDLESWPADEKLPLQNRVVHDAQGFAAERPVRPITTHEARQFCNWTVTDVPKGEIADAIQAGIAAARQ